MSRSLKLYLTGLVSCSAIALLLTGFAFSRDTRFILGMRPQISVDPNSLTELNVFLGLAFWTLITLFAGALPVRMPRGTLVSVAIAPILAAMTLGGPVAAGWVALVGTTELREVRGRVPWYGTAANHAGIVLPAVIGSLCSELIRGNATGEIAIFAATMVGAAVVFTLN